MKTIPIALADAYESGGTTFAWAIRVERQDGAVYGWTSADVDAVIGGTLYRSGPGLDVASLVMSAGFDVDNTEMTIIADGDELVKADLLSGRWDGAAYELFRYDWSNTSGGRDIWKTGNFGNVQPRRGSFVVELRGLRQHLQQSLGNVTQPTCRNRLGDARCKVDLAPFTVTGAITAVDSAVRFHDTARSEPDGWFQAGSVTWTSGQNEGVTMLVRASLADGTITLGFGAVLPIEVGDTYEMVAGCTRRLLEDCRDKFDNVLNFNGEPHVPGPDLITAPSAFVEP